MAAALGLGTAAVGAGTSLYNMFGGGGSRQPTAGNVSIPQAWSPDKASMNAASNWILQGDPAGGGIGSLGAYNMVPQLLPYAQSTFQNLYNNPYAASAQTGAGNAASMGMGAATNAYGAGGDLMRTGAGVFPYARQLLDMGFDPQNEFYNRAAGRLTDQTRAALAARGVAMTPYGAGIEGQTLGNFNLDWENQALQRALSGAGGASGLYGTGSNLTTTGAGLQAGAAPLYMTSAMYPYATARGIAGDQAGAIDAYSRFGASGAAIPQQQIQDYLDFLRAGTGAAGVANQSGQLALNQNQQAFNQQQTLDKQQQGWGSQLGSSLALAGKNWPNSWNTGWGNQNLPGASTVAGF